MRYMENCDTNNSNKIDLQDNDLQEAISVHIPIIESIEDGKKLSKFLCDLLHCNAADKPNDYGVLFSLFNKVLPVMVVIEDRYVDRVYRDSYYMYYSSKHKRYSSFCKRLSLFKGPLETSDFDVVGTSKMRESFIGSIVIRPLDNRHVGRSLLNPYYFINDSENSYVKSNKYTIVVCGCSLTVEAFPFSMQDVETTTCAETTILNLTDYFSKRYQNYRFVLPSDIAKIEDRDGYERPLPSKGLRYSEISKVLSELGFSPRLFSIEMYEPLHLKRIMHYYLESGIPVAVGVRRHDTRLHSIICIGHGKIDKNKKSKRIFSGNGHELWVVDTSDLCDNYVVMDDSKGPYRTIQWKENTNDFSTVSGGHSFGNSELTTVVVPMYKRMFLEAEDAFKVCMDFLCEMESTFNIPLVHNSGKMGVEENPLFVRFFMASSRHFKEKRLANFKETNDDSIMYYAATYFPKFVWVCELYSEDGYAKDQPKAIGEIVIDATASKHDKGLALIVRFGEHIVIETLEDNADQIDENESTPPQESENDIDKNAKERFNKNCRYHYVLENHGLIDAYDCNLQKPRETPV